MSGVARVHPGCALGLSLTLLVGCREPDPPLLVAKPGCGIEDGLIDNLRVKARGDFPDGSGTEVRLSGGTQTLAWGDRPVVGVTVEGLFGGAVEAVGRTARLHEDGDIPVYFARVDGLCPVDDDDAAPREAVAAAVGPLGDVVLAGGSGVLGSPRDDVLHLHDEEGTLRVLPGRLPVPVVGQSVHAIDERRFLMVGGAASDGQVRAEVVLIDLDDDDAPVGEPVPVPVSIEQGPARAHHAAAVSPGGTVLLAGGCQRVNAALGCPTESESDPHVDGPAVLGTSLWIDPHDGLDFGPGPALEVPRFGATLMFARDGVAFLAGGRDALGVPVHVVERRRPGDSVFGVYGAPDPSAPVDTTPVVGSALLEGGVVVLVLEDGRVLWVNERGRGEFPGWCDGTGPCFDLVAPRRGVIALPGERVLIDGIVLPVGSVGLDGSSVVDLFAVGPRNPAPPPRRMGAQPVLLADGSVLLLGGRHPDSGSLALPVALRMRPALDGPDEGIPELDRSVAGSLVATDLERVTLESDTLRLLADPESDQQFPPVRVHARGFRSASFRFEVTLFAVGAAVPHLVLEHGAVEAVSVSLERDHVQGHVRSADGSVVEVSCASQGIDPSEVQVLRVDVSPEGITLGRGGDTVAQCPGLGDSPWSVGVGVSGSGELQASGLRLSRR